MDKKIFIGILIGFVVLISIYFLFFRSGENGIEDIKISSEEQKTTGDLVSAEGKFVNLEDYEGKVVFMNNWASWCRPCIVEMPTIAKLRQSLPEDKVEFVMLSFDRSPEKGTGWMNQSGFQLPVYFPGDQLPSQYLTNSIPATFVFNKKGEVVYTHVGMADYSTDVFINKMKQWIEE